MSTSGRILSISGTPLSTSTDAPAVDPSAPAPRGIAAVRASHIVALATAQSAMATASNVAEQRGKIVEATQAKDVSLQLAQLALALRDALHDHISDVKLRDRHDYSVIPEALVEALDDYATTGHETGGFLRAVLEGDLFGAVMRADAFSARVLPQLVGYLHNAEHIPASCFGSPLKVAQWVATKSAERVAAMQAHDTLRAEGSRELPDVPLPDPSDAPATEGPSNG